MGEDFAPGDRVRVEGYDTPGERATKVDGMEGTVALSHGGDDPYVSVALDAGDFLGIETWLFLPRELVKI